MRTVLLVRHGETALVVTHGGVLKLLRAILTDRDREATLAMDSPPNCSVTEVRLDGSADARRVRRDAVAGLTYSPPG